MSKLVRSILCALILASSASAETVRIRSGDHPGFSRLVIELAEPAAWRLGRIEGGYGLEIDRENIRYNTREVYRLIGRNRLKEISHDDQTGRLELKIACNCHVKAVDFNTSWIVIDILDGAAPNDWVFETPLENSVESSTEARPTLTQETTETAEAPVRPSTTSSDITALQNHWLEKLVTQNENSPNAMDTPHANQNRETIEEQEAHLLEELSRAASQGLLEANLPPVETLETFPHTPKQPETAPVDQPIKAMDHVRIEAETSVDRDSALFRSTNDVTSEGTQCIPNSMIALEEWGGSGDVLAELANRRKALVGEFDRPDPEAVLKLAQFYIYLGFGAEAKSTIEVFDTNSPELEIVRLLASLLDNDHSGLPGALANQTDCNGRVVLWSILAEGEISLQKEPNYPAMHAAFSALPLHLRRHVGPKLAEIFLEVGDEVTAITLRNAITRAPGDHGAELELLNAKIARGEDSDLANVQLENLLDENPAIAAEAYIEFLEAELEIPRVPEDAAKTAASLAFEMAGTEMGDKLAELAVRAILVSGDFDEARREILNLQEQRGRYDPALWQAFAGALLTAPQDGVFLRQFFASKNELTQAESSEEVTAALAARLTRLGFAKETLNFLREDTNNDAVKTARAEALLELTSPKDSIAILDSIYGEDADRIKGRALLIDGQLRTAAEHLAKVGDTETAERTAWMAGAWDLLDKSDNQVMREVAERRLASGKHNENHDEPNGHVHRARAALDDTNTSRDLIIELLSE